jgi:hypothetical protein
VQSAEDREARSTDHFIRGAGFPPSRSALLEAQGTKDSSESWGLSTEGKSHAKAQSTSICRLRTNGSALKGYFELNASLAQIVMAIGKENKITQRIFSSSIRFLGSLYGNKLILTIPYPPFYVGFFFRSFSLWLDYKMGDFQIRTKGGFKKGLRRD